MNEVVASEIDFLSKRSQKYNGKSGTLVMTSFLREVEKTAQPDFRKWLAISEPISLSFPTIKAEGMREF